MKVIIEFTPGSDFQEKVGGEMLVVMLSAWQAHMRNNHKKNEIKISYEPYNPIKYRGLKNET